MPPALTPSRRLALAITAIIIFHSCTLPDRPVSKEEALSLSHHIEVAAANRNPVLIDNIFDEQRFIKRVAAEVDRPLDKGFMTGAAEGLRAAHFGQQIMAALGKGGSYKLVKQYEKDGHQHLLFRLYYEGSVNYHDFDLVKVGDDIKAQDIYIYLSGENFSKTLADGLLGIQETPSLSAKDVDRIQSMKNIRTYLSQGEYEKANDLYTGLPDTLKKQRLFQLIHIEVASKMGDSVYGAAMDEYKGHFPNDPNMYLMMVDAYVIQKNYQKALESVNKLDSIINKDPFQDYYRALIYKLMMDSADARICLERLHQNMPTFADGDVELISNYIRGNNMTRAVELARQDRKDSILSEAKLNILYTLHPDFKTAMEH